MISSLLVIGTILLVRCSASLDPQICNAGGQVCNGCDEVVLCIETPDGFITNHMNFCSDGETCLRTECTDEKNPPCGLEGDLEFICHDVGMFPDPFDCRKYHFCVPQDGEVLHYPASCDADHGYDPNSLSCKTKLVNNVCEDWPIELCKLPGQTGIIANHPSYFYICADYSETIDVVYPHVYVCPNGGSYGDYKCTAALRKYYSALMAVNKKN